jgi:hypothetical protein
MGLLFKSRKGWYLLNGGGAVQYVGSPVSSFDTDTVHGVHLVESQHQVRCLTSARMLVWDYLANQWSEWTISNGTSATVWNSTYTYGTSTGALVEQSTYTNLTYGLDIETPWIKIADLQGSSAVRWVMLIGEYRSAHDLRVQIAYNYSESDASGPTWLDDKFWTVSPTTVGGALQLRFGPKIHKVESIKLRITPYAVGSTSSKPTGEALRLTGLGLEVGAKRGLFRRLPAAQKT